MILKGNIQPFASAHPDRWGEVRPLETQQAAASAFQVAAFDLRAGLAVPLPHKQCDPLARPRVAEHGEAGEVRPLVLLLDLILLSGIGDKLSHLHFKHLPSPRMLLSVSLLYHICF